MTAPKASPSRQRAPALPDGSSKGDGPRLRLSIQSGERATIPDISRQRIRRWVLAAIHHPAEIVLRFVDLREGRLLNAAYRGQNHATNVLTFDYTEPGHTRASATRRADIVICMNVVQREARQQHKDLVHHLAHMVVHGTLHAMGYDHVDAEQAERMEALEARLLRRFRIDDPYLPPAGRARKSPARPRRA